MMQLHVKSVHKKMKNKCGSCSETFSQKGNLQRHFKAIHEKTKHICDTCNKIFSHKDNLVRHVKSVHGKLNETCNSNKESENSKTGKHGEILQDKIKISCGYCGKKFNDIYKLKRHIMTVHER